MTPTAPAGGRGLRLSVLGFPVRIDLSFVLVMAFLGYGSGTTFGRIVLWVVIGAVAVLAHELGHALVARTTGADPTIELHGFGGVTRFAPPAPMSRLRSLAVTLAGPAVGVVVGVVLLLALPRDTFVPGSTGEYVRDVAIFVNLGWGVLNLLPILPLDGGQALAELLPGSPDVRARRAAMVSLPIAVVIGIVAWRYGYIFGALLAAWFAFDNGRLIAGPRSEASRALPAPRPMTAADRDLLWLLDQGRADQARHLLATLERDADVDPAVVGLVLTAAGRVEQGRPLVREAFTQAPDDPLRVAVLARLLLGDRDWPGLMALATGPTGALVPSDLLTAAGERARRDGSWQTADDLSAIADARRAAGPYDGHAATPA
jgi:Zn-dependent protease